LEISLKGKAIERMVATTGAAVTTRSYCLYHALQLSTLIITPWLRLGKNEKWREKARKYNFLNKFRNDISIYLVTFFKFENKNHKEQKRPKTLDHG
jgi:hypothetical protein